MTSDISKIIDIFNGAKVDFYYVFNIIEIIATFISPILHVFWIYSIWKARWNIANFKKPDPDNENQPLL